jgi:hypothetical protein
MFRGLFASTIAGLIATSAAERDFVPLFSWSDRSYLSAGVTNVASVDAVASVFGGIISQENPEVVVAVIYDQLGSTTAFRANGAYGEKHPELAGSALSEMETTLSGAASSFSVPYLYVDQASVSSTLTSLFAEGNVHQATDCEAAVELLSGAVLNNGVPDLVLLSIPARSGLSVECLGGLTRAAKNYVAIVSADHSDRRIVTNFPQPEGLKGANRKLMAAPTPTPWVWVGPQYILPNILLGLFFMFGFIFVVLVGVCCLMQIQTPIRFPHTNLRPPKEY